MFNKSPLRYPGGKSKACKILHEILKTHFDLNDFKNIISPFFGGGSFEFFLQNTYDLNIVANDKFTPLYNFWSICKNQNSELCAELYKYIDNVSKNDFTQFRSDILSKTDFDQAVLFFIINRCSFSGSTLSGGFSSESSKKRFTTSSIDRIKQLNLSNFNISNQDFQVFLNENIDTNSFIFLDPPYFLEKSNLYGNNGDLHEKFDHSALFYSIYNKKNWLMTYNNCDYIKNLYKDFIIIETDWKYSMNKSKKSSEIVIISL